MLKREPDRQLALMNFSIEAGILLLGKREPSVASKRAVTVVWENSMITTLPPPPPQQLGHAVAVVAAAAAVAAGAVSVLKCAVLSVIRFSIIQALKCVRGASSALMTHATDACAHASRPINPTTHKFKSGRVAIVWDLP